MVLTEFGLSAMVRKLIEHSQSVLQETTSHHLYKLNDQPSTTILNHHSLGPLKPWESSIRRTQIPIIIQDVGTVAAMVSAHTFASTFECFIPRSR